MFNIKFSFTHIMLFNNLPKRLLEIEQLISTINDYIICKAVEIFSDVNIVTLKSIIRSNSQ